ncbi:MAG: hypothetical protein Q8N53_24035 [Longimicrobiales bacterium]|nr:hypothetical protein [Longimicrobiales bacterium]
MVIRWPPPGLERLQGDLWRVAGRGALSGGILVLPLVFVTTLSQDFSSLGPFADAWWIALVLAAAGLGFAVDALASAARLLRRVADAVENGCDASTVLWVLADARKDMGFLLQGTRHFSVMDAGQRARVARLRVLAAGCHAVAGIWLPVVLGVALLSAARGVIGPTGVWIVTLVPAGALYLAGGVFGALEDSRVRRARASWYQRPWALDLDAQELETWRRELAAQQGHEAGPTRPARRAPAFRRGAIAVGALAVVVAVPVLTLIPTSAVGPVLALVALPRFGQIEVRAARMEAYRGYGVEPDAGISAQEAGRILQDLLHVGRRRPAGLGEREPTTGYDVTWLPDMEGPNPVGAQPHRWAEELFARVTQDPAPDLLAFLEGVAAHPAHRDFARLARAGELDVGAGRWSDPLPEGVSVLSLPVPKFASLREGAYAHLAAAAADLAAGREAEAESKIRDVISVGFLLGDHGPTLIDNLIGHVVVGTGGTALERFYEATGRLEDAHRIRDLADAAERSARRIHSIAPEGTEAFVRSLPGLVTDTSAVRGLRWESFVLTTTLVPCLNLQRMVFGPDDGYRAFLEEARSSLVRFPSEERLFEVARAGYWGAAAPGGASLFGRLLGVSMRPGEGSCNEVVKRFETLREAM